MELTLKNVGIIKDSTIKLDGLTVMTGPNNSGKSTVGKALYSLIRTEVLSPSEYAEEVSHTKSNCLLALSKELRFDLLTKYINVPSNNIGNTINILTLFMSLNLLGALNRNIEPFTAPDKLGGDIYDHLDDFFNGITKEYLISIAKPNALNDKIFIEYLDGFAEKKKKAYDEYKSIDKYINSSDNVRVFLKNTLSRILRAEYSNQVISNIFGDATDASGQVVLKDDGQIIDSITISGNGDVDSDSFVFNKVGFTNVILFDDAYSVDNLNRKIKSEYKYSHNQHLLYCLKNKPNETVFEEEMLKGEENRVLNLIKDSFPGNISKADTNYTYNDNIIKNLLVQNLATGSKCFATIKQLINNRQISKNSLLILDEPESHLHPEWQNIFAEIIVLLVKEWGIKVLLTTHSPNFLLALDTYMHKDKLSNSVHVYQSKQAPDHSVSFECVDDKINEAYAALALPFLQMDAMHSQLLQKTDGNGED